MQSVISPGSWGWDIVVSVSVGTIVYLDFDAGFARLHNRIYVMESNGATRLGSSLEFRRKGGVSGCDSPSPPSLSTQYFNSGQKFVQSGPIES